MGLEDLLRRASMVCGSILEGYRRDRTSEYEGLLTTELGSRIDSVSCTLLSLRTHFPFGPAGYRRT